MKRRPFAIILPLLLLSACGPSGPSFSESEPPLETTPTETDPSETKPTETKTESSSSEESNSEETSDSEDSASEDSSSAPVLEWREDPELLIAGYDVEYADVDKDDPSISYWLMAENYGGDTYAIYVYSSLFADDAYWGDIKIAVDGEPTTSIFSPLGVPNPYHYYCLLPLTRGTHTITVYYEPLKVYANLTAVLASTIPLSDATLSELELDLEVGEKWKLEFRNLTGNELRFLEYGFASSDESVVSVSSDGVVTALQVGTAEVWLESRTFTSEKCQVRIYDDDPSSEGLKYRLSPDQSGYLVTGYEGDSVNIIIPSIHHNKPVTGLAPGAFRGLTFIKSVVFHKGITSLPDEAFYGCEALETIDWGGITSLGDYTFYGCGNLHIYELPDQITAVGASCFEGALQAGPLYVHQETTNLDYFAFGEKVTALYLEEAEPTEDWLSILTYPSRRLTLYPACLSFIEEDGILYGKFNDDEHAYLTAAGLIETKERLNLPSAVNGLPVEEIGSDFAVASPETQSVSIPGSVKTIDDYAFLSNGEITSFAFAASADEAPLSIGERAIDCSSLDEIVLPARLTSVGQYGLSNASLVSIYLEGEIEEGFDQYWAPGRRFALERFVKKITADEGAVFAIYDNEDSSLQHAAIVDGKTSIPDSIEDIPVNRILPYAFEDTDFGESLTIPESIEIIEHHAFFNIRTPNIYLPTSVQQIEIDGFVPYWELEEPTIYYFGTEDGVGFADGWNDDYKVVYGYDPDAPVNPDEGGNEQ